MPKPTLFKNITVVTPDDKDGVSVIKNAYVAVVDRAISYVGIREADAIKALSNKGIAKIDIDQYDGKNRLLMPTFANAHSHMPMVLFRNSADNLKLEEWLFNHILPMEERLLDDDFYYGALLGMAEMIESGIGACADMYNAKHVTAAARQTGFRINLCEEVAFRKDGGWIIDPMPMSDAKKSIEQGSDGQFRVSALIHSIYLYPKELYPHIVQIATDTNAMIHLHLAETKTEVDNCLKTYGATPAQALYDVGAFDRPCLAAHCVHLTPNDRKLMCDTGVWAVHNPASNFKLASGMADVPAMLRDGVRVALGTDGCASNNNTNMFTDMRLASFTANAITHDPSVLTAQTIFRMATIDGYLAMGFEHTGRIEAGMTADLSILNYDTPSMWPLGDPVAALVYSGSPSCVESVMIQGRFVKYKGDLTTIDIEKVKAEVWSRSIRLRNEV